MESLSGQNALTDLRRMLNLHLLSYPHETCFMSFQATTQNSPVYSKIASQYARLAV